MILGGARTLATPGVHRRDPARRDLRAAVQQYLFRLVCFVVVYFVIMCCMLCSHVFVRRSNINRVG